MSHEHLVKGSSLSRQLLRCPPGKYDREERLQHRYTRKMDFAGLCLLSILYISILSTSTNDIPDVLLHPMFACQLLTAIISVYNLYVEIHVLPRGTKEAADDFRVTYGPFGRWVYLTHQTIGLLAVHSVISVLAPCLSQRLAYSTYTAAPVVGATGVFVTVQYFNLVFSHPDHKQNCRVWAARGFRFGFVDGLRHSLPIVIAVLDMVARDSHALSAAMPSAFHTLCIHAVYMLMFLCMVHTNHAITGCWPYGFMKELGSHVWKWLAFAAVQGMLLSACASFLYFLGRSERWV